MAKPLCGPDTAGMTLIEGARGVIVIDPPIRVEAALGLYGRDRPVTAVIYTHSHGDRLGDVANGDVLIIAPAGFLEPIVSPFPPTLDITHTGQEETVDGVRIVFQLTPGAEMNFFLPERHALYVAQYSTETIALFGARADVLFPPHHRPIRGNSTIMRYLAEQRDVDAYLHDQTLRMLGKGHTGTEIAELIQLPPVLEKAWHARGCPASTAHSVEAIYQRYLGWFDGNPASLWQHPPVETAQHYVDCFGGVGNIVAKAREFVDSGDLRFAARLLRHAVFASPGGETAKQLLARVYERLGHGTENPAWRAFYLAGAQELRSGITVTPMDLSAGMASALSVEQIFDTIAIRVDGPAAWHENLTIDWVLADGPYRTTLRNGVLIHHPRGEGDAAADLTLRLTKAELLELLAGQGLNGVSHEGDPDALKRLLSHLEMLGVA